MANKKVKLLVSTAFKGPRKEGEVLSVPEDFASRWVKNKIAVYVEGAVEKSEAVVEEAPSKESSYEDMSAKDLFALCKEKGIDVEAKKSKEYYIEKLSE